jgi:type I restriction enzyme M protein
MGNAGRNGGEYYTPRPLIRAIINVVDPKVGDTVYDGAVGSAGFLCEAFEYMSKQADTTSKRKTLQEKTFYGKEKKSLAYVIAVMNMILHGIDAPNIVHSNTLGENISLIQEKDRYNTFLQTLHSVVRNVPRCSKTSPSKLVKPHTCSCSTSSRFSKPRAAEVWSSKTPHCQILITHQSPSVDTCWKPATLHTILDLPSGAFQGAGVRTVVLFFDKGTPTKKIWYYQLNVGRNMGKTNPLNDADLADFRQVAKGQERFRQLLDSRHR